MRTPSVLTLQRLERAYGIDGDVDLRGFLRRHPVAEDADLADLIDLDGRLRAGLGRSTDLSRYLQAVPELGRMPVALDAAIESTMRSLKSRENCSDEEAAARLVREYPDYREVIEESAALSRGLWTSTWIRDQLAAHPKRELPSDFGPETKGGEGARYELRTCLGEGAAGRVYLAADRQLSDDRHTALVAVKILGAGAPTLSSGERFFAEATRARRVLHRNVVRVLDRGIDDGGEAYIVYDYVDGVTLLEWWGQAPESRPRRDVVDMVARIASGLHVAHRQGLVHRDLHPGNILVDEEGEPRICDFGLAHDAEDLDAEPAAWRERPQGNLAFMAPEQFRMEEGAPTAASDIYSLGGLLSFLLTGSPPNGSTVEEVTKALSAGGPGPTRPAIDDRDLESIIGRALDPDPAERHNSAAELASDLRAWLAREPIAWTRPSTARRAWLLFRRRPFATTSAVAACVALLVALGVGLWTYKTDAIRKQARRDSLTRIMSFIDSVESEADGAGVLAILRSLEFFDDRADLGKQATPSLLSSGRLKVIRKFVDEWRAAGVEFGVRRLAWESGVAYLMIADEAWRPDAEAILARNTEGWRRVAPDDPWLHELEVMRAIAVCKRVARKLERDEPIGAPELEELRAAAALLESVQRADDEGGFDPLSIGLRELAEHWFETLEETGLARLRSGRRGAPD